MTLVDTDTDTDTDGPLPIGRTDGTDTSDGAGAVRLPWASIVHARDGRVPVRRRRAEVGVDAETTRRLADQCALRSLDVRSVTTAALIIAIGQEGGPPPFTMGVPPLVGSRFDVGGNDLGDPATLARRLTMRADRGHDDRWAVVVAGPESADDPLAVVGEVRTEPSTGSGTELNVTWRGPTSRIAPAVLDRLVARTEATIHRLASTDPWHEPDGRSWGSPEPPAPGTGPTTSVVLDGRRLDTGLIVTIVESNPEVHRATLELGADGALQITILPAAGHTVPVARLRSQLRWRLPLWHQPRHWQVGWAEGAAAAEHAAVDGAVGTAVDDSVGGAVGGGGGGDPADDGSGWQAKLGAIWSEVLGGIEVSETDNFFALGGDSLRALRVVDRLRAQHGIDLRLDRSIGVFGTGDLRTAAIALTGVAGSTPPPQRPERTAPTIVSRPEEADAPFPLTDHQQAYVLGRSGQFELSHVSCHSYIEFDGTGVDPTRLARAWRRLGERHDAMRLRIDPETMTQTVRASGAGELVVDDLTGRADAVDAARRVRDRLSHRMADLGGDEPLSAAHLLLLPEGQRLCLSVDSLAVDLASINTLLNDLTLLYEDPDVALAPIPVSFRDCIVGRAPSAERDETVEIDRRYWLERAARLPGGPDLPLVVEPETVDRSRFHTAHRVIEAPHWATIRRQAVRWGISPSSVLVTAYAEVLGAWSRSPHFTINVPRFTRPAPDGGLDDTVGEFASLLLLEVDLAAAGPFGVRAREIQAQMWRDLAHDGIPGVEILRMLRQEGARFDQTMFPCVFTSAVGLPNGQTSVLDGRLTRTYRLSQTPQVWIDAIVEEGEDGSLHLNIDGVSELFPEGMLDQLADALHELVGRLASPSAWIEPVLDARPAAEATRQADRTGVTVPIADRGLVDGMLDHAQAHPNHVALRWHDTAITYGQLAAGTEPLRSWLDTCGHQRGQPVAIAIGKRPAQILATTATVAAGSAYLPVDVNAPAARLLDLVRGSGCTTVLTDRNKLGIAWPNDWRVAVVEDDGSVRDRHDRPAPSTPTPSPSSHPDQLAYILFTSGSTGTPKGVAVTGRAVLNAVAETAVRIDTGPGQVFLGVSALHHDMSVYDVFGALGHGATLVLPQGDHRDADLWADLVETHGVTSWVSVPAMMELLIERSTGAQIASLRHVILGGDWVTERLTSELFRRAPGIAVASVGGPTETTMWNIWHRVEPAAPGPGVPYGAPLPNTRYHILDDALRPRPDNVIGEMYCSGVGVSPGLHGHPERTDERFIVDPRTGLRLYRTGDLGWWRPDGEIEIAGRADFQLKVNGYRIEPGEVEVLLHQHPAIARSVVVGLPQPAGKGWRGLGAYLVAEPGHHIDTDDITRHMRASAPAHLVPAVYLEIDHLPLTTNGKPDRTALPPLTAQTTSDTTEATSLLCHVLTRLFANQLHLPHLGPNDDLFRLGADSLTMARIANHTTEQLPGIDIRLRDLFANTTPTAMTNVLANRHGHELVETIAGLWLEIANLDTDELNRRIASTIDEHPDHANAPEPTEGRTP
ncbi:MAG: amino acid adenylation domain-containing protein [Actinomycetota bacterium]